MGMISHNKITHANVYLEGNSLLGKVEECLLPDVKFKKIEKKALGMIGTVELFAGIEKMEAKIKWDSIYPDTFKNLANPLKILKLMIYASVEELTPNKSGEPGKLTTEIHGTINNFPLGLFQAGTKVQNIETSFSVVYLKQTYNDNPILEIDVLSNILKVEEEDVLQQQIGTING